MEDVEEAGEGGRKNLFSPAPTPFPLSPTPWVTQCTHPNLVPSLFHLPVPTPGDERGWERGCTNPRFSRFPNPRWRPGFSACSPIRLLCRLVFGEVASCQRRISTEGSNFFFCFLNEETRKRRRGLAIGELPGQVTEAHTMPYHKLGVLFLICCQF